MDTAPIKNPVLYRNYMFTTEMAFWCMLITIYEKKCSLSRLHECIIPFFGENSSNSLK